MSEVKNILFIMADQLRADYLSCYGHPHLKTPNIDALAARGVRFTRAYVQAPVCGPSRMSFYTGRYVSSHGSTYNGVPLRIGEMTIGDHLRPLGMRVALVGKTHMTEDRKGMQRLGVTRDTIEGVFAAECGFEPYERDDGLWPDEVNPRDLAYNRYLREQGYNVDNPWHEFANAGRGADGKILSGWLMRNARLPAAVKEEHSETAYMTDRAMDFIAEAGDTPWCLHLSYIKPHWPYIAPAPYHDMYGPGDVLPANRTEAERENAHPVVAAFMEHEESQNFARDNVREAVIPAYMGLIRQLDDHLGRLFAFLDERGLTENTMIVFTSDHGDYLGDHWLGEKELFHEESVRIPLIVCDPDSRADGTRGSVNGRLVEAIDLAPTFIEAMGGEVPEHILEGRSLLGLTRGERREWRNAAVSECDYAFRRARQELDRTPGNARAWMLRTERWKYVEYDGFRPQLFDLENDPREHNDLGDDPDYQPIREEMHERLFDWMRSRRMRVTISDEEVEQRTDTHKKRGFLFGVW
ncbi:alkaline phosphatase family protein [Chelativorans salis]|uniref:Alkaline phosphatase family protein n=1 Tax=Chelativorans salis TaxID=2978478 RepID=A0ABT2LVI9_9HYPH|nr:alkaline phosphatase family protein [Chelativorans sp. EGI FJ00035]MCT7377877.1 alkaline phosphatase family protein [Chelativorans sp. EGI FJ00035]